MKALSELRCRSLRSACNGILNKPVDLLPVLVRHQVVVPRPFDGVKEFWLVGQTVEFDPVNKRDDFIVGAVKNE